MAKGKKAIYAAIIGNGMIAVTKFVAAAITGSSAMLAIVLARETRGLLVGEAAEAELSEGVRRIALEDEAVSGVARVLTMHVGPDDVLANLDLTLCAGLGASEVADSMHRLERRIKGAHPRYLFMETAAVTTAGDRAEGATDG